MNKSSDNSKKSLAKKYILEKEAFSLRELADFLELNENDFILFAGAMLVKGAVAIDDDNKYLPITNTIQSWQNIAKGLSRFSEIKANEIPTNEDAYRNLVDEYYYCIEDGGTIDKKIELLTKINKIYTYVSLSVSALVGEKSFDAALSDYKNILDLSSFPEKKSTKNLGFVYIAKQTNESNLYKIGCTDNINNRLKTFKVGNCFVEMIASKQVFDKFYYEKFFHKYFSKKLFKGEWYKLTKEDLEELREIFCWNFHLDKDGGDK